MTDTQMNLEPMDYTEFSRAVQEVNKMDIESRFEAIRELFGRVWWSGWDAGTHLGHYRHGENGAAL